MPSTSAKQAKFMRAVANSPKFAKKVGVPQSVGKDFSMADKKMKKFGDGGKLKLTDKEKKMGDALMMTPRGRQVMDAQAKREAEAERKRREKQDAADKLLGVGAKKGGEMKKMNKGGMADKAGRALVRKSADTMGRAMVKKAGGGKCYAKGGSVSSRADGVAKKGKTNTKMVKMALGGSLGSSLSGMGMTNASPSQSASMSAAPGAPQAVNRMPSRLGSGESAPSGRMTQSASGNPGQVMRANASRKPQNMGGNTMLRRNKGGLSVMPKGKSC